MRAHGNKEFWLAALRAEGPTIVQALSEADPAAPVPSCPGWTVADLLGHLVRQYAWVNAHVGLGWRGRGSWTETRMLTARELRRLFPDARIERERLYGLTKSLMAIRGPR